MVNFTWYNKIIIWNIPAEANPLSIARVGFQVTCLQIVYSLEFKLFTDLIMIFDVKQIFSCSNMFERKLGVVPITFIF